MKKKRETGFDRAQKPIDAFLAFFELKERNFAPELRKRLAGGRRVTARRPGALKNTLIATGAVFFLFLLMAVASKQPLVLLAGLAICALLFVIIYLNHPTYCPSCGKEMKEERMLSTPVAFNYCKSCGVYARVRRVMEGE